MLVADSHKSSKVLQKSPNGDTPLSLRTIIIALTMTLQTFGCATGLSQKERIGSIIGAATGATVGAVLGSGKGRLVATAAGPFIGFLIGSEIGRYLDQADRDAMVETTQYTLENVPIGQTESWSNPDSGNKGSVTPTRSYKRNNGQQCREFTQRVEVEARSEEQHATACKQADGTWKLVKK